MRLRKAMLLTRDWTPEFGVVEHEVTVSNLGELLESCVQSGAHMPERITLTGIGRDGREHVVRFSFASSLTR